NVSGPQRTLYQSIGGSSPHWANTTEDITHFYAAVPANQLRTALWIEADRMAAPIAQVDEQQLDGARAVVEQERRQNIENVPFGVYRELTVAALFPPSHPYHVTALPPVADLFAASIGDLESTCRPYYVPNNAVIAVSGDFDTRTVRAWLDEYFASIPRRPGGACRRAGGEARRRETIGARGQACRAATAAHRLARRRVRGSRSPRAQRAGLGAVARAFRPTLARAGRRSTSCRRRGGGQLRSRKRRRVRDRRRTAARCVADDDRSRRRQRARRAPRIASDGGRAGAVQRVQRGDRRGIAPDAVRARRHARPRRDLRRRSRRLCQAGRGGALAHVNRRRAGRGALSDEGPCGDEPRTGRQARSREPARVAVHQRHTGRRGRNKAVSALRKRFAA